jgi:hypothetical protein
MEREAALPEHHGVARVRAAVETDDDVVLGDEVVDDLPLAFVAELQPDDGGFWWIRV